MDVKPLREVKATLLDDDAFRLLAFPFGGPIPSATHRRGVDLDGETFTERTDIRPDWLPWRPVDWHHGRDQLMGREVIAKAGDLGPRSGPGSEPDEDGWWVTVWMAHGNRRADLIRRLAEQAPIYGSSESVPGLVRKAADGEILAWPYWRQTLSTSPQNTYSVMVPLKATLDDIEAAGGEAGPSFWADIEAALRSLEPSFRLPAGYGASVGAKAERDAATLELDPAAIAATDRLLAALDRLGHTIRI